jgi:hypothetical protein
MISFILLKTFISIKTTMENLSIKKYLLGAIIVLVMTSCVHVKEYQKSRINDSEMTLSNKAVEKNELNAESYREGSSGANGGKTGGGCGCN